MCTCVWYVYTVCTINYISIYQCPPPQKPQNLLTHLMSWKSMIAASWEMPTTLVGESLDHERLVGHQVTSPITYHDASSSTFYWLYLWAQLTTIHLIDVLLCSFFPSPQKWKHNLTPPEITGFSRKITKHRKSPKTVLPTFRWNSVKVAPIEGVVHITHNLTRRLLETGGAPNGGALVDVGWQPSNQTHPATPFRPYPGHTALPGADLLSGCDSRLWSTWVFQ